MNYSRKNKGFLRAFLNVFVMVSLVSQVALAPLSVVHADSTSTCNVTTKETINPGDTVEWTASLSGSGDTVEFTWSGDDGLSGSTETVSKTYTTSGTKSATVSVKAIGSSTSTMCDGITYVITPGANTPPVITVTGDNPQTITIGDSYTELGATATDVEDGDLTPNIVTDATAVDTDTLGDYTVTYNVVDSEGLAADEKTRTVSVVAAANTKPVITVTGDNPLEITVGDTFTDPGATANDAEDGDITGDIVVAGDTVDNTTVGSYTITYNVVDSEGLAADEKTRVVNVVAAVNTAPVITLVGDNPQILTIGDAYAELGATANDAEDGDITADIVTDSSTVNMAVVGDYTVTYNVVDSEGLAATEVTRTVKVIPATSAVCTISVTTTIDGQAVVWSTPELPAGENPTYSWSGDDGLSGSTATTTHTYTTAGTYEGTVIVTGDTSASCSISTDLNTPPTITLIGDNPLSIVIGDTFVDPGATAFDIEDGDLTGDIVVTGTVGTSTGNYVLVYSVTDSDGNTASVNRTVIVMPIASCAAPYIDPASLAASGTVGTPFSYTYTATSSTSIIVSTSTLPAGLSVATTSDTAIISGVPTATGVFSVPFSIVNTCGTSTAAFVLTITGGGGGGGNTPPTITLIGSSTVNIFVGDDYIDQGATAFDAEDGDITSLIIATSTVSTTTAGTYTVDYSVTDSGGLTATTSRTVIVSPITCTAPSMTSSGTVSATKGQNFEYSLSFTPNATTTVVTVDSATLPAGLAFSTTTNKITGTPTDLGTFTVNFNLENDCGDTDVEVKITVSEAPCTTCGGGGGGGGGGGSSTPTLTIFNEQIVPVLDNAAIIKWNTNNPATSRVVYGTTTIASPDAALPNYGYTLTTATLTGLITSHSMGVTFEPGVKYYFRPISTAGGLTAVGKELTITFEAPTTCSYLRDFLRIDFDNDPQEVIKLQAYLNSFEGETLDVNGIFDQETLEATNRYQDKYFGQILSPWGHEEHTGYVYILTKKHINETYCKTAYPLTVLEEQEIDAFRALLESLRNAGVDNGGEVEPTDIGNTTGPDVNDGTIGLGDGNATSTDNGGNIAIGGDDNGTVAGTTTPETGFATTLTNLAGVLFAFPDSVQEGVVCAGWLALILLVVYLLGTLLVNILSRDEAVSERELRIRKLATYIVGLVYAFIPVLIFDLNCITLPLALIIGLIVLFIIYLVVKEAKTKKVNY